jgi:hypothetical protein
VEQTHTHCVFQELVFGRQDTVQLVICEASNCGIARAVHAAGAVKVTSAYPRRHTAMIYLGALHSLHWTDSHGGRGNRAARSPRLCAAVGEW